MKPETARGSRRPLPRRKRSGTKRPEHGPGAAGRPEGNLEDFDPVEFAEFLEDEDGPIPVDPHFKETLRDRLWTMVRERAAPPERPRGGTRRHRDD